MRFKVFRKKNIPMALVWQLAVCGPLVRFINRKKGVDSTNERCYLILRQMYYDSRSTIVVTTIDEVNCYECQNNMHILMRN